MLNRCADGAVNQTYDLAYNLSIGIFQDAKRVG